MGDQARARRVVDPVSRAGYELVFEDTFDSDTLDQTRWLPQTITGMIGTSADTAIRTAPDCEEAELFQGAIRFANRHPARVIPLRHLPFRGQFLTGQHPAGGYLVLDPFRDGFRYPP